MTLGESLRAAREAANLTVEDVSRSTRIRGQLIRNIESDDFTACGGAVYARGHIRSIAAAVGVDPAPLIAEFDAEHGGVEGPAPREIFEHEVLAIPDRKGPNWTAAMAAAAALAVIVAVVTLLNPNTANSPGVAGPDDGISSTSPSPSASASAPAPTVAPTDLTAFNRDGVVVQVKLVGDKSWVRITDEKGTQLFQGVLTQGMVREFRSANLLYVVLGNAGAVSLTVNGRDLGSPGAVGEVVRTQFGKGDPTAAG